MRESEIAISSNLDRSSFQISPFDANHGDASWVTKLVKALNKWPTTLSKLILTTGLIFLFSGLLIEHQFWKFVAVAFYYHKHNSLILIMWVKYSGSFQFRLWHRVDSLIVKLRCIKFFAGFFFLNFRTCRGTASELKCNSLAVFQILLWFSMRELY